MSEKRQKKTQLPVRTAHFGFQEQAEAINQSLLQLAKNVAEAEYRPLLADCEQRCKQAVADLLKQRLKSQKLEKEKGSLQQKLKEIEKRQQAVKQLQLKLKRESKELEILDLHQGLKQKVCNQELTNTHMQEIIKLKSQMAKTKGQLQSKLSQLARINKNNAELSEKLISTQYELTTQRSSYNTLRQQSLTAKNKSIAEINKLTEQYSSRAIQLQQALKKNYSFKIQQKQWQIQDLKREMQNQKKLYQDQLLKFNKNMEQASQINKNYLQKLYSLEEQLNTKELQCINIAKRLTQASVDFQNQLKQERKKLQASFQKEVNGYYASYSNQIKEEVQAIKKEYQKLADTRKKESKAEIQRINITFNTQKLELQSQIQDYRKQLQDQKLQDQRIQYKNRYQQEKRTTNIKVNQLEAIITNISNIVLGRTYKVNYSKISQSIQSKVNDLRTEISSLQKSQANTQRANGVLEADAKEVRKWFRNITSLLNSTQAAAVLEKNKLYAITDPDVLSSMNSFTSKLQARLKKHQDDEQARELEISQLNEEMKKVNTAKNSFEKTAARLNERNQVLQNQLRSQKQSAEKIARESTANIDRLQKQVKQLLNSLAVKEADIILLKQEIDGLYNVKIAAYTKRITEQANKNDDLQTKIKKLQIIIDGLEDQKKALGEKLANRRLESDQRLEKLEELKQQITEKANEWKSEREINMNRFRAVLNELYDTPAVENNFDSMLEYLKNHKPASEAGPFIVSPIFQTSPKERGALETYICRFLKCKAIKATFLYKYDQFNKNFSNYLPTKTAYDFVIIAKSKKQQIFGVFSSGLGPRSKAMAFNLNSGKTFTGDSNVNSSTYDGGYLIFGQGEIRFKSNSSLEIVVTTRIFNTRYFSFVKEEFVGGVENGDSVLLDALEIHRIDY